MEKPVVWVEFAPNRLKTEDLGEKILTPGEIVMIAGTLSVILSFVYLEHNTRTSKNDLVLYLVSISLMIAGLVGLLLTG